jgi:hypothetical protein
MNDNIPRLPVGYVMEWSDPDNIPDGWEIDEELTKYHQSLYACPPGVDVIFPEDLGRPWYPHNVAIRKLPYEDPP